MKYLPFLFISFIKINSYGQTVDLNLEINKIVSILVPIEFDRFNLIDSSCITKYTDFDIQDSIKICSLYKDLNFPDLLMKHKRNHTLNWSNYQIHGANIIKDLPSEYWYKPCNCIKIEHKHNLVHDSIQVITLGNIIKIKLRSSRSNKANNKKLTKAIRKCNRRISAKDILYLSLSNLTISENNIYGMLSFAKNGCGGTLLLKRENLIWKEIFVFSTWCY